MFLQENIPEVVGIFEKLFLEKYKKDAKLSVDEKYVFDDNIKFDIDRIFNRLVFFHPEIKDNYPFLFEEQKSL